MVSVEELLFGTRNRGRVREIEEERAIPAGQMPEQTRGGLEPGRESGLIPEHAPRGWMIRAGATPRQTSMTYDSV